MKKVIPFKKEIIFENNIAEITSISLEHNLEIKDNSVIGNFEISGSYKMTLTSTITEDFNYNLPFEIALDDRYLIDDATIDIDDFYYEIINDKILSINIEVVIDKLEEIKMEDKMPNKIVEKKEFEEIVENIDKEKNIENNKERCIEEENPISNVFTTISDTETYKSYTVYIVRENDTIENILTKYNITKEDLEIYNNIEELKIGDKLIIPNA